MKILFTICGRAGSKGIKNKNIRNFLEKPLPLYTLSTIDLFLNHHPEIEYNIAVNTDSPELIQILHGSSMRSVEYIERKEALAGDTIGKIAVIKDCLDVMEQQGSMYDMVIDLDITSPLRKVGDLEAVYHEKKTGNWDVVFTVTEARRNPYFNMVKKENDSYVKVIPSDYTARQQAPQIYDMNASIYAFSPMFLKRGMNLFDGKCGIVKMQDTGVLDLDHENDFELMEAIAEYLFNVNKLFADVYENIKSHHK